MSVFPLMRPKLQKRSALKLAGRIIPQGISSKVENTNIQTYLGGSVPLFGLYILFDLFSPQKVSQTSNAAETHFLFFILLNFLLIRQQIFATYLFPKMKKSPNLKSPGMPYSIRNSNKRCLDYVLDSFLATSLFRQVFWLPDQPNCCAFPSSIDSGL